MNTETDFFSAPTTGRTRTSRRMAILGLSFLFPLLMGGCPEYRNDLVSIVETATQSALLTDQDRWAIADAATLALVDATLDLFFDQFRTE